MRVISPRVGNCVVFLELRWKARGSSRVATGTWRNLSCCFRGVRPPFELWGRIWDCSWVAVGESGLISSCSRKLYSLPATTTEAHRPESPHSTREAPAKRSLMLKQKVAPLATTREKHMQQRKRSTVWKKFQKILNVFKKWHPWQNNRNGWWLTADTQISEFTHEHVSEFQGLSMAMKF